MQSTRLFGFDHFEHRIICLANNFIPILAVMLSLALSQLSSPLSMNQLSVQFLSSHPRGWSFSFEENNSIFLSQGPPLTTPTQPKTPQLRESEDNTELHNTAQQELGFPSASEITTLHLPFTKTCVWICFILPICSDAPLSRQNFLPSYNISPYDWMLCNNSD